MDRKLPLIIAALLVLIISPCRIFAEPVSPTRATKAAAMFAERNFHAAEKLWRAPAALNAAPARWPMELLDPDTGDTLAYVIELEPDGFIVTSAETQIEPVIFYTTTGRFPTEESPENILLDVLRADLKLRLMALPLTAQAVKQANETKWGQWQSAPADAPVETAQWPAWDGWVWTTWDQDSPYNTSCPVDPKTSLRCLTGCVATAMAQIVNYWEYPYSVTFTSTESYTSVYDPGDGFGTRTISISAPGASISYISYPLTSSARAALIYACGVSVQMQYTSDGSAASTVDVASALTDKMGYDSARYVDNTGSSFYTTLQNNMKNARPAQLAIHGDSGGHSIVCDGYRDTGSYHLNLGWSGSSDGWYSLPSGLIPEGFDTVNYGVLDIVAQAVCPTPSAPSGLSDTAKTTTSITWSWADNSADEEGFRGYDQPSIKQWETTAASYVEPGLTANTSYTRSVRAYNSCGESGSSTHTAWTLPVAPAVSCSNDHPVDTTYAFTSSVALGAGGVDHCHYAWDQTPSRTLTGLEPEWRAGQLRLVASQAGGWYLHVLSHSGGGDPGGAIDLGPYQGLGAPVVDPEPPCTLGTENTVSWQAVDSADAYMAECGTDATFASTNSSGWAAGLSATFSNLPPGRTYWYRAKALKLMPAMDSQWAQTTQADFQAGTLDKATATTAGEVALAGAPPTTDVLGDGTSQFSYKLKARLNAYECSEDRTLTQIEAFLLVRLATHLQFAVYEGEGATLNGSYTRIHLSDVDVPGTPDATEGQFSGSGSIAVQLKKGKFYLIGVGSQGWAMHTWSANPNFPITTSFGSARGNVECDSYPAPDTITTTPGSTIAYYQRLSSVESIQYEPSGGVISPEIAPVPFYLWGTLTFTKTTPPGTALSVDVLDGSGNLLAGNVASETDLNALGIVQNPIKLRASLTTVDTSLTPILSDWSVSSRAGQESAWSNVVFSTQGWPIPGDANLDCAVNILDLFMIRGKLNQDPATGNNWQADVNGDGSINILDLYYVRNRLNNKCP